MARPENASLAAMKHVILSILLSGLSLACTSTASSDVDIPCTCGQPEADLDGCAHALCLAGKSNPDNPDCVCGALSLGGNN